MAYTPQQQQTIQLARSLSRGYAPKVQRALLEALAVESSFRPLPYGDRDSVGVLQQRPSQGWGPASETPAMDIRQFLSRAARANQQGGYGTAGQLAQAVQRSAFPGRYDQHRAEAIRLLGRGSGAIDNGRTIPSPGISSATGGNVRAQLAQNLIAASQASSRGETPDYSQTFQLVATLRSPQTGAPLPVFSQGGGSPVAKQAVALAERYQGTPYVWGGSKPGGFDCSGLLQYVWAQKGVKIPRTTYEQFKKGQPVVQGNLRPGDAVFFKGSDSKGGLPGHVGMYVGNGRFIEAPHTGSVVRVSKLAGRSDFVGARRYA